MTCFICSLIEKKQKKIYEDDEIIAFLNPTPSVHGHTLVAPKKHLQIITQLDDKTVERMFFVSQQISSLLYDAVGAEGTNIIIQNGVVAGQKHAHFLMNIIPRAKDDGLSFEWAQKQIPEDNMNKIQEALQTSEAKKEEKMEEIVEEKKKEERNEKEDYLIKQLRRLP
jgi:histidine triad (HIT) family protein